MAPPNANNLSEGLLSKEESIDSESHRPIIIKSTRRYGILYTSSCILAGMLFSLALVSLMSSIKVTSLRPVNLYTGDAMTAPLNPPLEPGEEPIENSNNCGSSPEEAKALGCKFDIILYSWVPAPCYDEEIQTAYKKRESEWWRKRGGAGGQKIDQHQAALGTEESMWLSWDYHDYHCQFIWRMMTRMLRNTSMGVPGRLLEYYHTDHCIQVLKGIDPGPAEDISTEVSLNYSTCYFR